jgi:uncharacterized protein
MINSRKELEDVPGMGPKTFEQCAGFLKIPESREVLDNSWVHPENYEAARLIKDNITTTGNLSGAALSKIKEQYKLGEITINDIVTELNRPGRDPREDYPKPVMQKGVVHFEDLTEGQVVTGKIKNVVDFGAFVDLGIKETALVHISEISDNYISDPHTVLKVGDVFEFRIIALDVERKRISLSRKSPSAKAQSAKAQAAKTQTANTQGAKAESSKSHDAKPHDAKPLGGKSLGGKPPDIKSEPSGKAVVKTSARRESKPDHEWTGSSDGTMYNPFAALLKNRVKQ